MANFSGTPLQIARMLGFVDIDSPDNLPPGLAALCRNAEFSITSVMTRAGVNLQAGGVAAGIQGLYKTPITGLLGMIYQPENTSQSWFQLPLLFQDKTDHSAGSLQGEVNVGSGTTLEITGPTITLPARSHMQAAQAYNNAFMAFSDLISPTGGCALLNLEEYKYTNSALALWQYGMKPFGWSWMPNTPMIRWEVGTPTTKNANGAVYQFQPTLNTSATGVTGATEPVWPAKGSGLTVNDGTGYWTEMTPTSSMVYQCYPPSPLWTATADNGGDWPVGPDGNAEWICFVFTYVTAAGETDVLNAFVGIDTPSGAFYDNVGPPVTGTQSYSISCPAPAGAPPGFTGDVPTGWNLYIALVPAGSQGIPDPTQFYKWNAFPLPFATPQTVLGQITAYGTAPTTNTANVVGAGNCNCSETIAATNAALGDYASPPGYQFGIRYAAVMFVNQNGSVSGFTQQSAIPVKIYYNGSTIIIANVPIGPEGTIARIVSLTNLQFDDVDPRTLPQYPLGERWAPVSNGTSAGPYFYIGNYVQGPNYFVSPQTTLSDGYKESAMILGDNVATEGYFSYTEPYLIASNDVTDRLRVIWPYQCVDIYYSESTDRMIQTGVVGYNGHWVSLAADPESYYSDSSFIPTQNSDGEKALCAREFRGQLFSLRERSGYVMQIVSIDDVGNPTWSVRKRWGKVGPCGPRAVDVCGKFLIFVHRSGIYKYDGNPNAEGGAPEPMKVSKEIRYWWKSINWKARQTIWVSIDEETHTVRIGVPTGSSLVPNQVILLSYEEGWNLPIHFSTFAQKEISMDQARRYSIHDVSAYLGMRIERDIPVPNNDYTIFERGDEGIEWLSSEFFTSQIMYGSSAYDGAVLAITPGIWHDGEGGPNPATGIDFRYETMSQGVMLSQSKFEGFSLNSRGQGKLFWAVLKGRTQILDWTPDGPNATSDQFLTGPPIDLVPNQHVGDTALTRADFGERWRMHFSNGAIPDAWAELKFCVEYAIPFSSGRPESQQK